MLIDVDTLRAKRPDLVAALTPVKESSRPRYVKKNNGAMDQGHVIFESSKKPARTPFERADRLRREAELKRGEITAEQFRILNGDEHPEVASLTESQKAEYRFARLGGMSEADCLRLVKITR